MWSLKYRIMKDKETNKVKLFIPNYALLRPQSIRLIDIAFAKERSVFGPSQRNHLFETNRL